MCTNSPVSLKERKDYMVLHTNITNNAIPLAPEAKKSRLWGKKENEGLQ
jgi:hypothetical protein